MAGSDRVAAGRGPRHEGVVVLSYEADGVRWWLERLAASNRSVPPAKLVLTWVSSADPALIARRVDDVVGGLELRASD